VPILDFLTTQTTMRGLFFPAKHTAAFPESGFSGITDTFSGTEWGGSSGTELFTTIYSKPIAGKSSCA